MADFDHDLHRLPVSYNVLAIAPQDEQARCCVRPEYCVDKAVPAAGFAASPGIGNSKSPMSGAPCWLWGSLLPESGPVGSAQVLSFPSSPLHS
jgi:hypothetical protein